jgi:hypothetical protein
MKLIISLETSLNDVLVIKQIIGLNSLQVVLIMYFAYSHADFAGNRSGIGDHAILPASAHDQNRLKVFNTMYDMLICALDSSHPVAGFELWFPKWSANGFRTANGQPVKNADLIRYLAALLYARERAGPKVVFKHVRGHVGIEGNECADRLANDGALKPELPERDWEQLIRDLEKKPNPLKSNISTSRLATVTSSGSSRPSITTCVALPPREPTPQPGFLSQAELEVSNHKLGLSLCSQAITCPGLCKLPS